MAGPFDFLHIKGSTAGSSNELSFDVLDAARHELDEKRRANRSSTPLTSGTPSSLGSYSGIAGTSTLSAVPEVERRKRARRARAIRMRVIAVVAVVALLAVGAYAGWRFYEEKVDYTGRFGELVSRFVEVDKSIVEVDALMADPLNSVERETRDRALAGFSDVKAKLDAISADARDLARNAASDDDKAALAEVEDAVQARKEMLDAAADTFKLSEIANRQVAEATEAWNLVLAGDALAREATTLANVATTEDATLHARDKTQEALDQMNTARSQLSIIEQGIAGLDFSAEVAYVDKRIESLEAALETSDALLAGNREAAIAANDAYNAADREAAEMASDLPASISDQVKAQYSGEVEQKRSAYSSARADATTADSALRSQFQPIAG